MDVECVGKNWPFLVGRGHVGVKICKGKSNIQKTSWDWARPGNQPWQWKIHHLYGTFHCRSVYLHVNNRVVFRCSESFEPTASMNSSYGMAWCICWKLMKTRPQGLGSLLQPQIQWAWSQKNLAGHPSRQAAQEMHDVVPSPHPLPAPRKHSCLTHLHTKISTQPPAASSQLAGSAAGAFRFGVYAATLILHGVQLLRRHSVIELQVSYLQNLILFCTLVLFQGTQIWPQMTSDLPPCSELMLICTALLPPRACMENSTLSCILQRFVASKFCSSLLSVQSSTSGLILRELLWSVCFAEVAIPRQPEAYLLLNDSMILKCLLLFKTK